MRSIPKGQMTLKSPVLIAALACAILFGGAGPVSAKTYTLEQCLKLAKENRASIERARGDKRNATAQVKRQFSRVFLPSLSARYGKSESRARDQKTEALGPPNGFPDQLTTVGGNTIPVFIDTGGVRPIVQFDVPDQDRSSSFFSLSANITLFDGFSNWHDYAGTRSASSQSSFDLKRSEQNLDLEVKAFYFAYLANIRNLTVQEEAVKRSQEQLNLVQSRYDVGSASLSDVLKQKVQFGNDNLTLLEAQNRAQTTKADLTFAAGLDLSDEIDFDTSYTENQYSGAMKQAINIGLAEHPGLRSAALDEKMNSHFLKSSYGDYVPSASAFVSQTWSTSSRADNLDQAFDFESKTLQFGVNVSWNIFDKYLREQSVIGRKVALNNSKAQRWETRNRVILDIKKAFLEVDKATEQVKVSTETVVSASEDMNLAQEKYNLGSASILDLLDAQVSLKDAQVSLIRSKLDLNLAVAKLENAMGS